jgi:hypothetical protein
MSGAEQENVHDDSASETLLSSCRGDAFFSVVTMWGATVSSLGLTLVALLWRDRDATRLHDFSWRSVVGRTR